MNIAKNKNLRSILSKTYNCDLDKYIIDNKTLKSNMISSGAIAVGNDIKRILAEEYILKEMFTNKQIEKLSSILIDYPQHIVTSLISLVKENTGWEPLLANKKGNSESYRKYLSSILSRGLFFIETSSTDKIHYNKNNYKSLFEKIFQQYHETSAQEKQYIKTLTTNSIENIPDKDSNILLTHIVISPTLNVVRLYLYSAEIKFCYVMTKIVRNISQQLTQQEKLRYQNYSLDF